MSDTDTQNLNFKYAWSALGRAGMPKRSAADRAADFLEIYGPYDEATAREQASRCIQCPNPTCVTGCPLCNPIPEWMQLTAEGRFLEAAAVLGNASNLAEICARLCPSDHLCEGACLLESVSKPVSIQHLEQFLVEYAIANGQADTSTAPPNGMKVAVVGSGPGGLACADELARKGHAVTIFDSALVPGGLLVNGVAAFKLDKSIIQRRIAMLEKKGVKFLLGAKLWNKTTLSDLRAGFDAVFLGFDSRKARSLQVPGAELRGVVQALPFLLQKNTAVTLEIPPIDLKGKKVVVIGAGDTAMDCLRTAIRYGAQEATGVCRRERADMRCAEQEYDNAVEEGARFVFCASPVAILGDENGQVKGVRFIRTEIGLNDSSEPRPFLVRHGTEFDLAADWVILALGFEPQPCPQIDDFSHLAVNDWGGVVVDKDQMTSIPGVFAGGDIVRGPAPVLLAVRDGRRAADQIHAFLARRRQSGHL